MGPTRCRNPELLDYGTYRLVDPSMNAVIHYAGGAFHYGLDLDDVEDFLRLRERGT